MLRHKMFSAVLLCLAMCMVGCEQTISGLGGKPSPNLPIGESHYLKVAANANQQQIDMSRLALQRSHNDQVRNFAQQQLDARSKAQDQLSTLAEAKGAELPTSLGNIELGTVNDLASTPDADFDKNYAQSQVAALQNQVNDANAEAMNGADPDLKAHAQQSLLQLQTELVNAKNLQSSLNGK
jgi:putative membrane protein